MKIIHFSLFQYGFEINGRVAEDKLYSYWGTTGYSRGSGFYDKPSCLLKFYRFRLNFTLFIGWVH